MEPRQPPVAADAAPVGLEAPALVRGGDEVVRRFYGPHRLAERLRTRPDLRAPRVVLRQCRVAAARRVARRAARRARGRGGGRRSFACSGLRFKNYGILYPLQTFNKDIFFPFK